jgi:putative ABC transport system permease protein
MKALRAFFVRLAGWRGRAGRELQLQEELEAHFQMHVDDNLRAGMDPASARRAAALRFGSVDAAKEEVRARWTLGFFEDTRQDVIYALRGLRRNPAFAATAIASLALGIGAGVAIFTVADNLLLRPLPYREPDRLVMVWEYNSRFSRTPYPYNVVSPANFRDWKAQDTVFENMAAVGDGRTVLQDGARAEEVGIEYVTFDMLPMLGVQPWRGRFFTREEDLPRAPDVAILSYRCWQSWFAGDEGVIGRKIQFGGRPATVVGVMPPGFYFRNRDTDLWSTIGLDPARDYRKSSGRYLDCVARLRPGVSFDAAQTQMTTLAKRIEAANPVFDKNWTVNLETLRDSTLRGVKTSMYVLLGAVGLLLAVACANVANLLLARHTARIREMSVRAAIGAGRWRVVRQLVTESLVLGLSGGLLGLALARWAVAGLLALAPRDLARNAAIAVDLRIVLFAVGLSLLTGLIFGIAPAFAASRTDVLTGLRDGARGNAGGHRRIRSGLAAAEVALSLALLAGAGLLFRTLVGLQAVDPGLDARNVLTFRVSLPGARYREPAQRLQFFTRALDEIRALPGVHSASAINYLPFHGMSAGTSVAIAGRPPARPGEELSARIRTVMPGYFQSIGIPIRKGRDFNNSDNSLDAPYRFIVNEAFVRSYFPGEEPIGHSIKANMQDQNPFGEIVGVVGDVKEGSVDHEPSPTVYYNEAHMLAGWMTFVLRVSGDPLQLAEPARRVIRGIDAAQPVADVQPMENIVRETFARQRFSAILLIGFSLVALALAAVGIYGVLAYSVTERTREIGVRMALGADATRVIAMVLASGARVVAAGTAAGLLGAFALTGLLKTMLFGVNTHDAATFVAAPLGLAAVAMLAAYVPARRASRVAPADALRAD